MNTIGLLLVLGLAFFALKQKSEKTRNMLLIASALLGFCMFSAEGFTGIKFGDAAAPTGAAIAAVRGSVTVPDPPGNTITGTDDSVYTFAEGPFAIDTDEPTCGANKVMGTINRATVTATGNLQSSNINDVFPCVAATDCPEVASATDASAVTAQNALCGTDKTYKSNITGLKYTGTSGGEDFKTQCCSPSATPPPQATPMPNCGPNAECDGSVPTLGGADVATNKSNQCGSTMFGQWDMTCRCIKDTETWTSGASNGCTAVPA